MSDKLLATKLFIPPPPARLLPRPRLLDLLERGLAPENRLILVCAPAGYGKTTLAGEWLHPGGVEAPPPAASAWVTLDGSDDDPLQFFAYLAAALKKALPEWDGALPAALHAPQPLPLQALFTALINDLAAENRRLLIILDDYQVIHNAAIHEGVVFFLDHLPPGVHLLVISRSDPPFPIHRYRARGQLVEIRSKDLRFTPQEIPRLIRDFTGYAPGVEETDILSERTEGWAAGLQMAAISLRGRPDAGGFIQSLASSRQYILDYLAEEVFNAQPRQVQRFLLATSLFDRFGAPLCEALEMFDPAEGGASAEETLAYLVRANLFLIPLDAGGTWFRYHALFADLLRLRLKRAAGEPVPVRELHRRASQWFEAEGWSAEATQHALEAGDYARAADLVERHTLDLFSQGELHRLVRWIHMVPEDTAARRPWLKVRQAWAYAFAGRLAEAEVLVRQAQAAVDAGSDPPGERAKLEAELVGIRCMVALMAGRAGEALALAERPAGAFPAESAFAYAAVLWASGYAWRQRGELVRARQAFEAMLALSRRPGFLWTVVTASVDLGAVLRQLGLLRRAESVYREALDEARRAEAGSTGYLGRLESFLAQTLHDQNELEEARRFSLASIEHNRLWENPNHTAHAHLIHAKIAQALGDAETAAAALARAGAVAAQAPLVPNLQAAIEAAQVRHWLVQGDLAAAERWAEPRRGDFAAGLLFDEGREQIELAIARTDLALGRRAAARQRLEVLEAAARKAQRSAALIEILALIAQAAEGEAASAALGGALALGLPQNFVRLFLDEGQVLAGLLRSYQASGRVEEALRSQLDRLVDQLPQPDAQKPSLLTPRELEILRGMARGMANAQIGRELFISPGTVKAHSAAIYRKLDAANRTEAIARAKDLGLI